MRNNCVTLARKGDGWHGSFSIALEALVTDILSDGAPFLAHITWDLDNGDEMYEQHWVEALKDGRVVVRVGEPIDVLDITKIEVG